MKHRPYGIYEAYVKRPLDVICAIFALTILAPVIIIVAILVRIKLGSPVIYSQERPGRMDETGREKVFRLYKFRSMTDECDESGQPLPDEKRLTRFGRTLRSTSLDELPELINIIRGDMSIVGPRPLLVRYLDRYSSEQRRRHEVRPGLTGLAQISGRNAISWDEKFRLDVEYVDRVTWATDAWIVLRTVAKVIKREGISSEGEATMEEFGG